MRRPPDPMGQDTPDPSLSSAGVAASLGEAPSHQDMGPKLEEGGPWGPSQGVGGLWGPNLEEGDPWGPSQEVGGLWGPSPGMGEVLDSNQEVGDLLGPSHKRDPIPEEGVP